MTQQALNQKLAFVYPGQGSQYVGMGRDLASKFDMVRDLFAQAEEILGRPITRIMYEGPEEELRLTIHTQPALLLCDIACHEALNVRGVEPTMVAGHSLGEYAALYAAGMIEFASVVKLVKLRAELMQEAGEKHPGAMAAIMGMDDVRLTKLCSETPGTVVVANYNAPGQVVVSGEVEAVGKLAEAAKAAGAKRALMLPVSGAFHSPLMGEAAQQLAAAIDETPLKPPTVALVSNVDGKSHSSVEEIRENLKAQMTSSVQWTRSIHAMVTHGVQGVVEAGAGKVLTGLIRRIDKNLACYNVGTVAELELFCPGSWSEGYRVN